jgi:hypothetical protein
MKQLVKNPNKLKSFKKHLLQVTSEVNKLDSNISTNQTASTHTYELTQLATLFKSIIKLDTTVTSGIQYQDETITPRYSKRINKPQYNKSIVNSNTTVYLVHNSVALKTGNDIVIPLDQALTGPRRKEWIQAINMELSAQRLNETWELCELPIDKRTLTTKFILRPKYDENGKEIKLKARLVIQGYKQNYLEDFNEIYAPVSKLTTLRTFFSIANHFNMKMQQIDVKTAFLNAKLNDEIYIEIPWGIDPEEELEKLPSTHPLRINYTGKAHELKLRVNKSIYGLKQAPHDWYNTINTFIINQLGYKPTSADPCLYYKNQRIQNAFFKTSKGYH